MSERHSRASSLSLVSGLGTSSVSGTSESGHVNVEELDDETLASVIHKLKDHIKSQRMETDIFESYFERLMSGNFSIGNTSSTQSRKTSATQSSNMTPESDSIIQTPSLLDGQRGRLSRKKSSSRTSLASRHKSMKLSIEQRVGIARKELTRIECELKEDRALSQQKIHNGNFILEERSQRILELIKSIECLEKTIRSSDHTSDDQNKEFLNARDSISAFLHQQLKYEQRHLNKMKTRNTVIKSRIAQISAEIKTRQATMDEIGTVDRTQLYLENNKFLKDLSEFEERLTNCRGELRELRIQMDKYAKEHSSSTERRDQTIKDNQRLKSTTHNLRRTIQLKKMEHNRVNKDYKRLLVQSNSLKKEPPSLDELADRYLRREKNVSATSAMLRKEGLRKLLIMNKEKKVSEEPKEDQGSYIYKGLTYDLYFCVPEH